MSTKKLTKKVVNERIKNRGFELISEYINTYSTSLFRCPNNHTWKTSPSNVMRGKGCPHCSNKFPLTKAVVNEKIKNRGLELISEYINTYSTSLFRCANNHEWNAIPNSVLQGGGCPHCSNCFPLTKAVVNERIKDRGFELISEYINTRSPSLFRCSYNHTWKTRPSDVMQGKGCPRCSVHGFKPNKSAHGYLLDFGHFIKFGISNILKTRLVKHKKNNGSYTVIKTKLFENGQDALDWENDIKKKYGGWYVSKDVFPDGYTETLPMFFKETLLITLDF